jgi:hypothetical protein
VAQLGALPAAGLGRGERAPAGRRRTRRRARAAPGGGRLPVGPARGGVHAGAGLHRRRRTGRPRRLRPPAGRRRRHRLARRTPATRRPATPCRPPA